MTGDPESIGVFSGGEFGITDGIILSTGSVCTAAESVLESVQGTTYVASAGTDFAPSGPVGDTTSLTVSFLASEAKGIYFDYVFASSELPDWGGSQYNDAFVMAINGQNLALLQDGRRVTINTLVPSKAQPSLYSSDYIDNPQLQYFPYSGYTKVSLCPSADRVTMPSFVLPVVKVLSASGLTRIGNNTINITVYDVHDGKWDSTIFLKVRYCSRHLCHSCRH